MLIAFAALDLSQSPAAVGLAVGVRSLLFILSVLFAAPIAQRAGVRTTLAASIAGTCLATAILALLLLLGISTLGALSVVAAVSGMFAGAAFPLTSGLVKTAVPADQLRKANGLSRLAANLTTFVGVGVAGLLASITSTGVALLLLLAASFAGFVATHSLAALPGKDDSSIAALGLIAELRGGWRVFTRLPWVLAITAAFAFVNLAGSGGLQILGPLIASDSLGRAAWGFAIAAQTAGFLAGGVLATRWRPRRALTLTVCLSVLEILPLLALAFMSPLYLLMLSMFASGVVIELFGVAWDVALQEAFTFDELGHVYAYDALGSYLTIPLGQSLVGPLTLAFGPRVVLLAASVIVVISISAALFNRSLRVHV